MRGTASHAVASTAYRTQYMRKRSACRSARWLTWLIRRSRAAGGQPEPEVAYPGADRAENVAEGGAHFIIDVVQSPAHFIEPATATRTPGWRGSGHGDWNLQRDLLDRRTGELRRMRWSERDVRVFRDGIRGTGDRGIPL